MATGPVAAAISAILEGLDAAWSLVLRLRAILRRQRGPSTPTPEESSPPPPHPGDVELFERIRKQLPFEPMGRFLKEQDFAGEFSHDEWWSIDEYLSLSESPEWRFMDSTLEALRLRLERDLGTLKQVGFGKVWATRDRRAFSVPDEWLSPSHVRHGDYWPAVKLLNHHARKAYESYALLIQKGRAKLRVD